MSDTTFRLHDIRPADRAAFLKGTFIMLFHCNRVPPHLLVVHDGSTWSISVKGQFPGEPLERILDYADRKNIPCILVEWNLNDAQRLDIREVLDAAIAKYPRVATGETSCLYPIREAVATMHGSDFLGADFIYELLPMMTAQGFIGSSYAYGFEPVNDFELLRYSNDQLRDAIRSSEQRQGSSV